VNSRMPTRQRNGEGHADGEVVDACTRSDPPGYWAQHVGKVIRATGETRRGEGSGLDADFGRRLRRESDRDIVPMKPGNAGGGKDPDFWTLLKTERIG
jgi:hypothetical protein